MTQLRIYAAAEQLGPPSALCLPFLMAELPHRHMMMAAYLHSADVPLGDNATLLRAGAPFTQSTPLQQQHSA